MKRIVIKIGTHIITSGTRISKSRVSNLVAMVAKLSQKYEILLVSSGAVGAGYTRLKLDKSDVANKQALAAIGQPYLMNRYIKEFKLHGIQIAQVLLGQAELNSRISTKYSYNAIKVLLQNKIIPIINENDVTSIKELNFGDNDQLSAHVAHYFEADMLVLLSDIDGLYDKDPRKYKDAVLIPTIHKIKKKDLETSKESGSEFGTGGIYTKLKAAKFLLKRNKPTFLTNGFELSALEDFLLGGKQTGGSLFTPAEI